MNSARPEELRFSAGGFDAPQFYPLTPHETAARHVILGLSVAFAMSVVAISSFVVSRTPAALNLSPAYREVQPEIVCSVTALGICVPEVRG